MNKRKILAISGVVLVSFLLISNTTLNQNVQGQQFKETIKGTENNQFLFSMINNLLSKLKNYDETNLKKLIPKIISYVDEPKFKNELIAAQSFFMEKLGKEFLNSIDTNSNLKIPANQLLNNCSDENTNGKNLVTLRVCKITGVEETTRELSTEEVIKLSALLDQSKKSLKVIHSETSDTYEKEEANVVVSNLYHYLKILDLLPENIDKEEAIDLINGEYGKKIIEKTGLFKTPLINQNQKKNNPMGDDIDNTWCSLSCDGSAHIEYMFIDMLLLILGMLPRFIIASPILIPAATILPIIVPTLLWMYVIVIILDELGYQVDKIMEVVDMFINIIILILEVFLWTFVPGVKLMYFHHKAIPERNIIGFAKISDGNLSVETQGLYGYKSGNVSDLEITGFLGLWIESNIQFPEFPDLLFKSTLSCNGYALGVRTPHV